MFLNGHRTEKLASRTQLRYYQVVKFAALKKKINLMLKNILFAIVVTFLCSMSSFAQNGEQNSRLLSRFSETELKSMSADEISYWESFLNHSVEIISLPAEKLEDIDESVNLPSLKLSEVNLFELGIEPHEFTRSYRKIVGTDKVLVIRSLAEIETFVPSLAIQANEEEYTAEELEAITAMGGGPILVPIANGGSITLPCGNGALFQHTFEDDNPAGPYASNANYTVTVCPDGTNGSKVTLRMFPEVGDTWDVHGSDTLFVYDGTDTNAPLLGAFNSDTDTNGISVQATFANPSGCLTFQFISDGANEGDGFGGLITCGYPCQPIAPIIGSDPLMEPADTGYIDICLGDTVWLYGNAGFPFSGTNGGLGYDQTIDNSTFNWEFADGTVINDNDTVFFVPQVRAGYLVEMRVTDTLGCVDVTTTKIRVATIPTFAGTTTLLTDTICFGESTILIGGVTFQDTAGVDPTQGAFINGGIFAGLTYLPDGSGVNYETEIEITQFDSGQVVQNASDIIDVCVTMEHSYLGDLEMMLTCPNGTEVVMFNSFTGQGINANFAGGFGGGGTFLGDPVDNTSGQPGVGWEYCFSELVTWGTMGDEHPTNTIPTTVNSPGQSMTPGTYLPEDSYSDLIGCPINGTWTLTIRDNIGADDGYIFEWGILFNPDIDPNAEFYTPSLANGFWTIEPSVINVFGDTAIEVLPPNPGDWDYTFNVEDDFGCFHDTTLMIHMVPQLTNLLDTAVCSDQFALNAADYEILGEWSYTPPLGGSVTFTPNEFEFNPNVEVSQYGDYEFVFQSDYCGQSDTVIIDFNPVPSNVALADQTVCPGATLTFDAENSGIAAVYSWQPTGETTQQITLENITQTTGIQVTINNECGTANGAATITVESIDVSTADPDVCLDVEAQLNADFTTNSGTWSFTGPAGATADFSPEITNANTSVTVSDEGSYQFVFTDDQCGMQDSVSVFFTPIPTINVSIDTNRICIEDNVVLTFTTNTELYTDFSWNPFGSNEDTLIIAGTDSMAFNPMDTLFHVIATVSNSCGDDSQEIVYKVIDCNLDIPNVFNPESSVPENQYFNIVALDLHPGNNMKIFDRWGRKCYDVDNYHLNPWNGGKESDGVFYYVLVRPGYEAETGYVHLVHGSGQ